MLTLGNVEGSMWDIYNIPITFKIILKFQLKNKQYISLETKILKNYKGK